MEVEVATVVAQHLTLEIGEETVVSASSCFYESPKIVTPRKIRYLLKIDDGFR